MKLFFYDCETTGIPDYGQPSDAEHQPHIVQAAGLLVDEQTREIEAAFDLIVRPDGWAIPAEVTAIHGLTNERAEACGVSERTIVDLILQFWRRSTRRVAHNRSFDDRIVRIGLKRFANSDIADEWKAGAGECTALLSSPICNLPPTEAQAKTNFKRKTPSLQEAYQFFFGEPFEGAHGALPDVDACMRVYWAIRDREVSHG